MQKSFLALSIFVCVLFLIANPASATEPLYEGGTHFNLTEQATRYYKDPAHGNYFQSLTDADIENLKTGSVDEDDPPLYLRSKRHFYDYFNERGLENILICGLSPCTSAKDWANAADEQIEVSGPDGNHTWDEAIRKFKTGDRNGAFYDLGHVLHLLEDMTSVAHTRNDMHIAGKISKEWAEPYELWAGDHPGLFYLDQNGNLTSDPTGNTHLLEGTTPLVFSTLDEYFDYLSYYTQRNFFSTDTVRDSAYSEPGLCEDGNPYFPCTKDVEKIINGLTYHLYYGRDPEDSSKAILLAYKTPLGISSTRNDGISQNYWKRLAKTGMRAVAGALDLFLAHATAVETKWEKTFGGANSDEGNSVQQTTDGGYIIAGWTSSMGAGSGDVYLVKTDSSGKDLWHQTFGGTDYDWGNSVQQTTDGGYIIAGGTESMGAGSGDVYLVKTDSSGKELWHQTFGGADWDWGNSVQQTSDGGYIIAGRTYADGYYDVYLVKTDSSGKELWHQTFGGAFWDQGYSVQQTTDGGYIIAGYTDSMGAGYKDVYLVKTDSSGRELWHQTFGGAGWDEGVSVQQTTDGGYVITGNTSLMGPGYDDNDVYLIKTDSSGRELWHQTFGGATWDFGYSVQQTTDGGYIIAGWTYSMGAGYSDVYLIKTDSLGNSK